MPALKIGTIACPILLVMLGLFSENKTEEFKTGQKYFLITIILVVVQDKISPSCLESFGMDILPSIAVC